MNNKDEQNHLAHELHTEINQSIDVIQKACVDNELSQFPVMCAMIAIIYEYKKANKTDNDSMAALKAFEDVMSRRIEEAPTLN